MSEEKNPFLAQDAPGPQAGGGFTPGGRSVEAGRVFEWLKQGWQLFTRNPGIWIALAVIMAVIMVVLSLIPFIGQLAANFLFPVFAAGLLLGCKSLSEGGELRIDHLFAGFKENTGNLVLLGVFYLIGVAIVFAVTFAIGGGAAMGGAMMGRGTGVGMALGGFLLAMIVFLVLSIPLAMAIWFAPALVVFHNLAPLDAMKASFGAWMKNIGPFIVNVVVAAVLCFIAAIPFGLGFLVLIPVMTGAVYTAYVEIFE